jgi:hypothetical protein
MLLGLTAIAVVLLTWLCWAMRASRLDARMRHEQRQHDHAALAPQLQMLLEAALSRDRETGIREEQARIAKLPIGAFLPTDQTAADLERDIRVAEDHFVDSRGPIRFSSRPSPTSGGNSRPEPWKPPARRSGRP